MNLVEKAWAKVHGSYGATEGGVVGTTLHDLTGAPAFDHVIKDTEDILGAINEAIENKWIVVCSTPS